MDGISLGYIRSCWCVHLQQICGTSEVGAQVCCNMMWQPETASWSFAHPYKYVRRCNNTQFWFTLFFISQDDDNDNDDYVTGTVVGCTRNLVWIGFGVTWVLVRGSGLLESLEEVEVDERTELLPDEGSGESNVNPRLRISRTLSTSLRYVLRFWKAKFRRWAVRNLHSNRRKQ